MGRKSVAYFAHDPAHRLLPASGGSDDEGGKQFTCGGCLVASAGRRYRCSHPGCSFTIHEACARGSPRKLKSAVHRRHQLRRRAGRPDGDGSVTCDMCGESVTGARYACSVCTIVVHPLRARMPGLASGPAHGHEAWLIRVGASSAAASCAARGTTVGAWRYGCVTCREVLHPRCSVPAADQCFRRGDDGDGEGDGERGSCCYGLLHDLTRCLATSGTALEYRGYYNGQ